MIDAAAVSDWGRFALPTGDELLLLERIIAAAEIKLRREFYFDSPASDDQEQALLLYAARLYKRRDTPEGREAFGGDIAVTISGADRDVVELLERRVGIA